MGKFFKHNQSIELCVGGDKKVENIADWHIKTYAYLLANQQKLLLRNCAEYDFPVIMNAWIGHTDYKVFFY